MYISVHAHYCSGPTPIHLYSHRDPRPLVQLVQSEILHVQSGRSPVVDGDPGRCPQGQPGSRWAAGPFEYSMIVQREEAFFLDRAVREIRVQVGTAMPALSAVLVCSGKGRYALCMYTICGKRAVTLLIVIR